MARHFTGTASVALLAVLSAHCSARYAQTAEEDSAMGGVSATGGTGGIGGLGEAGNGTGGAILSCPASLAARLTLTDVTVEEDIRYKHPGYDNFPNDERIALSVGPDGAAQVAWLDDTLRRVHVTPLSQAGRRSDADVVLAGNDLGGLVVRPDGFALLTRRDDPGEPLSDPSLGNTIAKAALLVRVKNRSEVFAAPLTGTAQVNAGLPSEQKRDCAGSPLFGRLAWNGSRYGAYFVVHGCSGHPEASFYADKLSYVDDNGNHSAGGWSWGCSMNQGLRLLPEPGAFTALCMSEGTPSHGLNLLLEGKPALQLSQEFVLSPGYCAGEFGSAVQMADGTYMIGWLSRGVGAGLKPANDLAFMRLGRDYTPLLPPTWLLETPVLAETNLHFAPYGPDRLLVTWDTIDDAFCDEHVCFGTYAGTHLRLIDGAGNFLTPDEVLSAPPNRDDDIVRFPNGDLGWAFVPEETRSYDGPLFPSPTGAPQVPSRRQLRIARLRYCL